MNTDLLTYRIVLIMANSQLDQELQCSICHEMFKDPRMLPCQHTFCLECLESVSKLTNGKAIDCSLCKRSHDLPIQEGAKGFPENMLMKSLLDMKNPSANAPPSHSELKKIKINFRRTKTHFLAFLKV